MRRIVMGSTVLLLGAAVSALATPRRPAGPEVVFSGRVSDASSGSPLAGAQVVLKGTRLGALTAADGRYRLAAVRTLQLGPSAVLVVSKLGYRTAEAQVSTTPDRVEHDVQLHPAALALEGLVVAGQAARARPVRDVSGLAAAAVAAGAVGSPPYRPRREPWNTEAYDRIEEQGFVAAASAPLSTFSIDVDRASYSNVRRFLMQGQRPPKDAVRIEELVNYFPYAYPPPAAGQPFSLTAEVASAPWRPQHRLLRIGLQSRRVETERLPPSNLVFLIDVSGSMQSPDKLPLVKQSLRLLVHELRAADRVALVVYAGSAGLVLPSTPGSEKTRILAAIDQLEAGGSTAGGAGLRLAYDVARQGYLPRGNNRVVLATDGDFNVGVSSDAEMVRLVEEKRREGTALTVLGFGTGNLKDSKMEKLADHGNGNYAYIDGLLEARKVLVQEMGGTLLTLAKDVKLQVEFNPARVQAYRLIGYENRRLANEAFNDDAKDAGELGAGHSVTALYEIVPVGVRTDVPIRGVDALRYQAPARADTRSAGAELAFVKVRYKEPREERSRLVQHAVRDRPAQPAGELAFAAAVAGFGMLLRDSEFRGALTAGQVLALARQARGQDAEGYRADFIRLVELYQNLRPGENHAARP